MRAWMAGIAVVLLASGVAEARTPLRFQERVVGQVDGFSSDVAIARLNADRRPDIAVAVERGVTEPGGVQVLLNRRPEFAVEPFVEGGVTPYRVGVGDLDGDRDVDAVIPNTVSQDLTVFGNDGSGGLSSMAGIAVPYLTRGVAVADLDGDGRDDVVTSSLDDPDGFTSAALRIFSGGGPGPPVTVPAEEFFVPAETIEAVDLNRDRRPDLVAVDQSGVLVSYRAGASFEPVRRVAAIEDGPFDVAAGDLNRDGRTDLATANLLGPRVSVLLRRRDNTGFEPPRHIEVGTGSAQVAVADFDGDRRNDLAVSLLDAGKVAVIRGARSGTFRPPQMIDAGPVPLALAAADMDGDRDPDLVVGDRDSHELRLLVNRARLPFLPGREPPNLARSAPIARPGR
jgi:FG-GAP-like repeat